MKKIIPIAGPSITKKEIDYVYDAIKNGWYENAFDYIKTRVIPKPRPFVKSYSFCKFFYYQTLSLQLSV